MDKLRLSELFEEKAKRFLEGAKSAMNYGDYSGAVYKAYYSIFHLSKAYLFLLGEDPETNRGIPLQVLWLLPPFPAPANPPAHHDHFPV